MTQNPNKVRDYVWSQLEDFYEGFYIGSPVVLCKKNPEKKRMVY